MGTYGPECRVQPRPPYSAPLGLDLMKWKELTGPGGLLRPCAVAAFHHRGVIRFEIKGGIMVSDIPGTVMSVWDPLGDKTDTITALQEGTGNTIMSKAGVRLAPTKLTV